MLIAITEVSNIFIISVRIKCVYLVGGKKLRRPFLATAVTAMLLAIVLIAGCATSTTQNNTTMSNASKTAPVAATSTATTVVTIPSITADQMRTKLTLTAPTTAKVNEEVPVSGTLICVICKEGISGALIHDQQWDPDLGKWVTLGSSYTTDENGFFHHNFAAHSAGTYYFRVAFDGDRQYVHAASDAVTVTVN